MGRALVVSILLFMGFCSGPIERLEVASGRFYSQFKSSVFVLQLDRFFGESSFP